MKNALFSKFLTAGLAAAATWLTLHLKTWFPGISDQEMLAFLEHIYEFCITAIAGISGAYIAGESYRASDNVKVPEKPKETTAK